MKKVSIVTITYNLIENERAELFKEMFLSLHNQTYPEIEHVIIDGNSTDGTQKFIRDCISKHRKKEVTFISENDNGINDATNKGLSLAKGDYLMIMCSDDYYKRLDAVELLVNACEKKRADFACGDSYWLEKKIWRAKPESFVYKHPFVINTLLLKKEIYEKIGGLDEKFGVASDYEFFFRLMLNTSKYAVVHKTLTALRAGGISGNKRKEKDIIRNYYDIYEKYYRECRFTKKDMKNFICAYKKPYSVSISQILKIIFRMKNSKMKYLFLKHYNIFYVIYHIICKLFLKFISFINFLYLILRTDII